MKDDLTVVLIESINLNPKLAPSEKLELVSQTLRDCKQKKIGKIVMDAIENRKTPKKVDGFNNEVVKRGRGRPKKQSTINRERTENEKAMIKVAQEVGTY